MIKKEFDIAGYKEIMANILDDPDGADKVFLKPLILRYRPMPVSGAKVVILIFCIPVM